MRGLISRQGAKTRCHTPFQGVSGPRCASLSHPYQPSSTQTHLDGAACRRTSPSAHSRTLCRVSSPSVDAPAAQPASAQSEQQTSSPSDDFEAFVSYIIQLQGEILLAAEQLDGGEATFKKDEWQRNPGDPNAGWGSTCVLEGGNILEKAAANITVVRGKLSATRAQAMSSRGRDEIDPNGGQEYAAAAMSLVFHSGHPLIPTLRADVRLFQVAGKSWYGGGCDLTPFYLNVQDTTDFHHYWKNTCDTYQTGLYDKYKQWCDKYFYIPARHEHRGVGGIFFDDLSSEECGFDAGAFTQDVGRGILASWLPIARRHADEPYTEQQRDWQLLRRGRYLEFNLLYDRGVKFGLDGGRIESIMVSAPPLIAWKYNVQPKPGSPEAELVEVLKHPRQWVA